MLIVVVGFGESSKLLPMMKIVNAGKIQSLNAVYPASTRILLEIQTAWKMNHSTCKHGMRIIANIQIAV